jgi:phage terminase small subunit
MSDSIGDDLTERERRFVEAYNETGNGTEAARQAGYAGDATSLAQQGSRLLKRPRVAAAIQAGAQKRSRLREISREERLDQLARVIVGETTELLVSGGGTIEVPARIRDRLKASELYARMKGELVQRIEHDLPGGVTELTSLVANALAKAAQARAEHEARTSTPKNDSD